jgi:hypothetical protein
MLVLGHVGITLGTIKFLCAVTEGKFISKTTEKKTVKPFLLRKFKSAHIFPNYQTSWLTSTVNQLDIRFLLIGSLLPDIIDKPVGLFFFSETFSNGRIFCHTLLFLILVTAMGFYFYRHHGKTWALALSIGTFAHLILDQMWFTPQTLFWPIFGFKFERLDISDWTINIFQELLTDPAVYIPELVGTVILIWFTLTLLYRRKAGVFLKYGRI